MPPVPPRCPQPPGGAGTTPRPPSAGGGEAPRRAGSLGSAKLGSQRRVKAGADARRTSTHPALGGCQRPCGSAPILKAGVGLAEVARATRAASIYAITFYFPYSLVFLTLQ